MKVLLVTEKKFAAEAVESIKEVIVKAGYEFDVLEKYTSKKQVLDKIADADAAIIRSDIFDKEVLEAGKKLKIVVRAGAGYDNVDLQTATAQNICVMNTPGQNANAVAELVLGLMVFKARNFYNGKSGTELKDKKLGIHAFGHVGQNVARIAQGFGMQVYAYDPYTPETVIRNAMVTPVSSVEELYATCQYVSIHIPATPETIKSINLKLMNSMPADAVLTNSARQEIINEEDLVTVMNTRKDFSYLTDIMPKNHTALVDKFNDRYFSTPKKMGAQTEEANVNAGIAAANQIVDFFVNGNEAYRVNKK